MSAEIRHAEPGELPDLTSIPGTVWVAVEDQAVVGHVAVRTIQGLAWITDLRVWGTDPQAAAKLCARARQEVRSLDLNEYRLTVDPQHPALFETLMERGHVVEQIVLRGTC